MRVLEIPYAIDTQRFTLRCYEPGDATELLAALDDGRERNERWLEWTRACASPPQVAAFLRRARGSFDLGKDFCFGVFSRDDGRLVGGVAAHVSDASVGRCAMEVWVRASASRAGVANEALVALSTMLFEVAAAQRLELLIEPNNVASRALASGLGFRKEGLFRGMLRRSDRVRDLVFYAMLRDDWRTTSRTGKSGARLRPISDEIAKASAG